MLLPVALCSPTPADHPRGGPASSQHSFHHNQKGTCLVTREAKQINNKVRPDTNSKAVLAATATVLALKVIDNRH